MRTAQTCGRTCGCDELCDFGERKAEAMHDTERDPSGWMADRAADRAERNMP